MKRTYSDMAASLSVLPPVNLELDNLFKSTLNGSYTLKIKKVADISKPADQPVEEIEEPEDSEAAFQKRLDQGTARVVQLDLIDANNQEIKALETERIEMLTDAKTNGLVTISGPVEIRCKNIMLEKRHVVKLVNGPNEETVKVERTAPAPERPEIIPVLDPAIMVQLDDDWDEEGEEDDCIVLD